jgi:diguanylate cyclase (GGDEF)-like protein/PAS domain S-box-containing protein
MITEHCQEIIEKLPHAFAYHQIITDQAGKAVDYLFIDFNRAFEKMTGLHRDQVIRRSVTEVLPGINESSFDWISTYGKVAATGEPINFRQFSEPLQKWYEVTAFSDQPGYFSTLFREITQDVVEKTALQAIVELSERCLHHYAENIDYDKIAETAKEISGARHVCFNRYSEDGTAMTTTAIAGISTIEDAVPVIGFNPVGKKWKLDPPRETHLAEHGIAVFDSLSQLTEGLLDVHTVHMIEKQYDIGKVYVARIENNGVALGDFTLLMSAGSNLQNVEYVRILSGLIGQHLERQSMLNQLLARTEQLRNSEEKFRLYTEQAPVGIFVADRNGNYTTVNQAACQMTGYTEQELLKQSILDSMAPEFYNEGLSMFARASQSGQVAGDILARRKNGEKYWASLVSLKLSDREIIGFVQDITDKKESAARLLSEHRQMLSIFDHMDTLIYVVDTDTYEVLFVNQYGRKIFGDIVGKTCWQAIHQDKSDRCSFCPIPRLTTQSEDQSEKIHREYFNEISKKWYHCTDSIISWSDGRPVKLTVAYDITERKESEKQDRFVSATMMNAYDSVVVTDCDFNITYVNKSTETLFGYQTQELVGRTVELLYSAQDVIRIHREVYPQITAGHTYTGEFLTRHKDGATFICELKVSPIIDDDGNPYAYIGTQRDITEQVMLKEQSYLEKEKFKTTLLSVGDAIIATDDQGHITVMNQVAEYLTEWTQEEAYGKPLMDVFQIIHEHTKIPCENPAKQVLLTGSVIELENHTSLVTKTGREIPVEDSAAPIKSANGLVTGVVIVFRDYTEKREKQKEVEYLSFHDHLTGLYNRRYLEDSLNRLDTPRNLPFAIIVIDVNGLKLTNDAYGHAMGDRLLKTTGTVLQNACRGDDIIARTGGDEFVILLPRTNRDQADSFKRRINTMVQNTKLDSVIISLAVGYAVKTEPDQDIHEVMKEADNRMYKNKLKYSRVMRSQTIEKVLRNINNKYDNEQIHTERVSQYCEAIARAMDFSETAVQEIKTVGILHDIGKIAISPDILSKKDKLTPEEWEEVKRHPITGYNILKSAEEYASFADVVLHHHERWDGKGYPSGLMGEDITLFSRIVAVADSYEAMTAKRSYQITKTKEEAIAELQRCAGTQFDAAIVKVFIDKVLN